MSYFSVSVANTKVNGVEALISIASPFLAVAPKSFQSLIKTLKGTYNDELHLYTVDCGKVGVLPEIRINLGPGFGIEYAVTAEKYVAKMVSSRLCHEKGRQVNGLLG